MRVALAAAGLLIVAGLLVITSRAAGWWPATYRQQERAADVAGRWPFPSRQVELVCHRHWGGGTSAFVVVHGREYALDGGPRADGRPSADRFVRGADRAQLTSLLLTLTDLYQDAHDLCR